MDDFIPAPGRNVVYAYAADPTEWATAMTAGRAYEGPIEYRPAQIVRVWSTDGPKTVNLVVFLDGSNDARLEPLAAAGHLVVWKTSVTIADYHGVVHHYLPRVPESV